MSAARPLPDSRNRLSVDARVVLELARKDLRAKFLGSHLGILWAFAQPAATILILWFVIRQAFRLSPVENFPFVLWLMAGLIPWYFVSDCINNATHSVVGNAHLVKKVVFRVEMLPVVKIVSCLAIHLVFLGILVVLLASSGYAPDAYSLQVFYYLLASLAFSLGLSWITSSLIVFLRDIGPVIGLALQILFWVTPIFWSPGGLSPRLRFLLQLNPVSYIVDGYRQSFVYKTWFWHHAGLSLYFWAVTGAILVAGIAIFRRLRPHFADVL